MFEGTTEKPKQYSKLHTGTDPASKVRGAISIIFVVKSHYWLTIVRDVK